MYEDLIRIKKYSSCLENAFLCPIHAISHQWKGGGIWRLAGWFQGLTGGTRSAQELCLAPPGKCWCVLTLMFTSTVLGAAQKGKYWLPGFSPCQTDCLRETALYVSLSITAESRHRLGFLSFRPRKALGSFPLCGKGEDWLFALRSYSDLQR